MSEAYRGEVPEISRVAAIDALQEANPNFYPPHSMVYTARRVQDLLTTLEYGDTTAHTSEHTRNLLSEQLSGLANPQTILHKNTHSKFFPSNPNASSFKPLYGEPDEEFFHATGLRDLQDLARIIEQPKSAWQFNSHVYVFTESDIHSQPAEVLYELGAPQMLEIFTAIGKEVTGTHNPQPLQAELFRVLQANGVMPYHYSNFDTQRQWLTAEAGSAKLLEAAEVLVGAHAHYHEILFSLLTDSQFMTPLTVQDNGSEQQVHTPASSELGQFATNNPYEPIIVHGQPQTFIGRRGKAKPGHRVFVAAGKTHSLTVGVAVPLEGSRLKHGTFKTEKLDVEVRGNSMLTVMALFNDNPDLIWRYGLQRLNVSEILFWLSSDKNARTMLTN